jgi:phosphoglycolate phosphatase
MREAGDLVSRKAIIFDFDGTIADTKASIISTATTVLKEWGVSDGDLARVGEIIGPPFPQAYEWVFGFSREDAIEITRQYRDIYNYLGVDAWPAFDGMRGLLEELRQARRLLAVASSKRTYLVRKGLEDNGIMYLFDTVRAKDADLESTKADAIRLALGDLGVTADEAVMVGDRFHDVEAATECGMACVGVLYGQTADRKELEEAGAAAIAETVAELRGVLLG